MFGVGTPVALQKKWGLKPPKVQNTKPNHQLGIRRNQCKAETRLQVDSRFGKEMARVRMNKRAVG